jgi:cell division protein FtsI (penicillin-binding protein 3)
MNERRPARVRSRLGFGLPMRMALVATVLGLCSVALVGRAAYVQLVNAEFYQRQGEARFLRELPIATSRGMITDRNGEPVAVSTPVESVWGNPQELLRHPDRLPELARALGLPADELSSRLSQRSDKEFYYLKRRINPDQAKAILALNIPGVFSQREFKRFYPQGEAMSHVLGFTNVDDRGQEGLELAFDEWLRGKPGSKRVIRDRHGRIVENIDLVKAAEPGKDLTLSIDRRIQFLAHRELRAALDKHKAASGSMVVLDVATGEVLAMVNLPGFNPNAVSGSQDARRNRAVTDLVEPGSTMKPITVAAALNAGKVTAASQFDTSPGTMALGRYTIRDTHNYGLLDVTGIIRKSSNIGSVKLAEPLPNQYFYDFIRGFGYGTPPKSGFPGEAAGVLPPPPRWSGSTKATISYGYGLSATPLQIAQAYAALGNHGRLMTPTFVKGQIGEARQVVSPEIADQVLQMMQTVTKPGGTATQAAILGYHVAGKTGTARQASAGGYSRRYVTTFAGLVPATNPRFAAVVVVNDPQAGSYYAGLVSAPVFRSVMEDALRLMDVQPDDIETWLAAQAEGEAKRLAGIKPLPAPLEEVFDDLAIPPAMAGTGGRP